MAVPCKVECILQQCLNMSKKCTFFDRGYCKHKNQCPQMHPSQDCQGECEDMNTCPKRHRTECKNGSSCPFLKSSSCEFLHSEAWEEEIRNSEVETLQILNDGQIARLSDLEEKLQTFDKILKESAENIEALKAKFSQKIDFLESKVAALESKFKEDDRVEYLDKETEKLDTNTKKDGNIFNYDISTKEFKNK